MAFGDNSRFVHSASPTVSINGQALTGIKDITIDANTNTSSYNVSISTAMTTAGTAMQQLGTAFVGNTSNPFGTPECTNHVTHPDLIEYQDDLVVAYCLNCEARITIARVPGGVNKLKMTNILAVMRENPGEESILPAILDLETTIETEIEELQNALILLSAAKDQTCRSLLP